MLHILDAMSLEEHLKPKLTQEESNQTDTESGGRNI